MPIVRGPLARVVLRGWIVLAMLLPLAAAAPAGAQSSTVRIVSDSSGQRLQVDGRDVVIRGVNWDYFPIGQNYSYTLWDQPDAAARGRGPANPYAGVGPPATRNHSKGSLRRARRGIIVPLIGCFSPRRPPPRPSRTRRRPR